jgi:hypothetical protein
MSKNTTTQLLDENPDTSGIAHTLLAGGGAVA